MHQKYHRLKHDSRDTIVHSSTQSLSSGTFSSTLLDGLRVLLVYHFLFDFYESGNESEAFYFFFKN